MEATKIKMNMDGTIRAKVLQYKSDGNTLTEKWETLTKFAEGIYLSYAAPDRYEQVYATVVFAKNGVFWKVGCEPEQCFNPDSYRYAENMGNLKRMYADYEADILQAATNGGWLNKLHITVMERLGHDAAPLLAAYEERKRKWQEEAKQPATPTEPPQSPETPQTVERTTDTPKPRETARKPQNRGTGGKRTTQRDTLRDTLRPVTYVPRECSTADAAYW